MKLYATTLGSGDRIRTDDLLVMSQMGCPSFPTPQSSVPSI